jgi:hypothetical protein
VLRGARREAVRRHGAQFDAPDSIIDSAGATTLIGVLPWQDHVRPA